MARIPTMGSAVSASCFGEAMAAVKDEHLRPINHKNNGSKQQRPSSHKAAQPESGSKGLLWAHILAHMDPYGPIYGPIWARMGLPGQVLEDYVNFP